MACLPLLLLFFSRSEPFSKSSEDIQLQSVRNLSTRPATDTKRGRPSKFPREDLLKVDAHLRMLLARETSISMRSFVGQYLPILDFPKDVREPLEQGDINLFEAHQLARLTAKRLGSNEAEARSHRRKLLEAHLRIQGSGAGLRERVIEALGEWSEPSPIETEMAALEKADELLEADPLDSTHLFFEELRRIGRALREIEPEDLTEEDVNSVMPVLDQLSAVLYQIEERKKRQRRQMKKLVI